MSSCGGSPADGRVCKRDPPPPPRHNLPRGRKAESEVRIGQAGRGRVREGARPMGAAACRGRGFKERARVSAERPMGAARCRQRHNPASCQPPRHATHAGP